MIFKMARPGGKSFHLRWNNHLSNLQTLFESLYNEQHLVDVTISCSDGFLKAHKLVLSACSPYFETIFKETPCKHPVIILKGILRHEMQAILEYMYAGAIDVHEDDLACLLQVANDLQVKGLVQKNDQSTNKTTPSKAEVEKNSVERTSNHDNESTSESEIPERIIKPEPMDLHENDENVDRNETDTGNNLAISTESNDSSSKEEMQTNSVLNGFMEHLEQKRMVPEGLEISKVKVECDVGNDDAMTEHLQKDYLTLYDFKGLYGNSGDGGASQMMRGNMINDKDLFCAICRRYFMNKQNMKRHLLTHSGEKQHQCTYCNAKFLRLSHLQRHQRTHTGEKPYACNQCSKTFSRSDKLKYHVEQQHAFGTKPYPPKQRGRPRKDPNLGSLQGALSLQNLYNLGTSLLQSNGAMNASQLSQKLSNDQQYDVTISALAGVPQSSSLNGSSSNID